MKRAYLAILSAFLALPACDACTPCAGTVGNCITVQDAPAVPAPDAGDPCSRSCAKLDRNRCLPAGMSAEACAQKCADDQAQGAASMLDPQVVLDAGSIQTLSKATGLACSGSPDAS